MKDLYTIAEFFYETKISLTKIYSMIKKKELSCLEKMVGGRKVKFIPKAELQRIKELQV